MSSRAEDGVTSVDVTSGIQRKLKARKTHKNDTFASVIARLLDIAEKYEVPPK